MAFLKKSVRSKTMWANLTVAVVAFFGGEYVKQFSHENVMTGLAAMNMLLRAVTKNSLFDD
jgi:hypothetical protein